MIQSMFPLLMLLLTGLINFSILFSGADAETQARWSRDLVPDLGRDQTGTYNLAGIAFIDEKRLLVYAVQRDLTQLSSRKSPEVSSSFRLHAWTVDADSGKSQAHQEWGTRAYDSEVRVTTAGVLVKTGEILKLYSPDFQHARHLPIAQNPNGKSYTSVSTSGRTIVVSQYFQKEQNYVSQVNVVDADTLKIRASWDQYPPIFHFSMSDNKFATSHNGTSSP